MTKHPDWPPPGKEPPQDMAESGADRDAVSEA